jgi:hypothetical protein
MSERVTRQKVAFERPFPIRLLGCDQPAGVYEVETIEELIDGLSFPSYRRVSTSIRLPIPESGPHSYQMIPISSSVVSKHGRPITAIEAL